MFLPRPLLNDEDEEERHAPSRQSTSSSPCIALRPGLVHRLYSHQLHVRAKAKLQRDRLLSGPMIDIYVGEAKRHWSLHRNLLCHHSEVLEAELEGDGEGNKRKETLELLEYDPAGFELLVKWLYQGKLDDVSDLADANQKYEYAVSCHKLYLLCDRLDMPQLKNVAMDQYRKGLNEAELVPDAEEIDDIYRQSPQGSPFRQLMTRIAARQIMDPGSDRDVETYRQCFENNPDFAVDLVKAIKHGTGGMLFEDPTDPGNPCQYHDHEDGPNCHIKGKGKVKQARKTPTNHRDQSSNKSPPSTNSDLQNPHPLPHPPKTPRQSLPRQARPQDGTSVGPLRRRLTSPAISTVGTSQEMATASPPPNQDASKDREKWRKVTPSERKKRPQEQKILEATETPSQHPVQEEPLQNSESASRQRPEDEQTLDGLENGKSVTQDKLQSPPSRRGIWEWARAGTGRLNIMGRIPHPEWKGPIARPEEVPADGGEGTQDDFSVPSATATTPHNPGQQSEVAAAKLEGLGISQANFASPSFSQTKRSSDELVAAASSTGTPESKASRIDNGQWTNGVESTPSNASKDSPPSTPDTPTPQQRNATSGKHEEIKADRNGSQIDQDAGKGSTVKTEAQHEVSSNAEDASETDSSARKMAKSNTSAKKVNGHSSSPNRIPKYKIALASNILRSGTPTSTS